MRFALFATFLLLATISSPAQQSKPEERLYRVTDSGVKPPQAISTPEPDFSSEARRGKFKGVVIISGYVGTDGKFHNAKVVRSIGDASLDAKALEGMKAWKFRPCTKDGKPINCAMNIEVSINLN
ncbi:MAG TPA: energy transducer TonB [Candidatus Angelobacter sp.]|jgi:protein TonB